MKTQHIVVTVLVLSVCQWSVLGQAEAPAASGSQPVPDTKQPPVPAPVPANVAVKDDTTVPPPTTTTIKPAPSPNTTSPAPPTPPTTPTTPKPSPTPTTSSTTTPTPPTTPTTTTTPKPTPTPPPSGRHFDAPSFIGGIVLTIGLIAIGIVGHKIYKAKFDRNYHTL